MEEEAKPFLYSDRFYKWLDNALDYGITEEQFWNMTIGELRRAVRSKLRVRKLEAQQKASFDYTLAQSIGRACGMAFGTVKSEFPDIGSVYPTLFDSEEIKRKKQERQAELSALRFKQFAESFNQKFNKEAAKN
jgi:hypothetical protein